ncbi:uncharacterized protein LOC123295552 isoform X2 [Chrysoperla carnea]|uniref:uncharacterized protein LOC123295552 isoform X2 n=1 Tax=Chrysoperla carnea TaxID=189513 RepID=UPI001D08F10E|nr:uncharacterized protein LOC123295552 isoform X2 [Chrysoperla carnea]
MPASGPVYQPTTVTYEQQTPENGNAGPTATWTRPVSYLSQTVSSHPNRARFVQWITLILGICLIASGLIMVVDGTIDYNDTTTTTTTTTHQNVTPSAANNSSDATESSVENSTTTEVQRGHASDLVCAIVGILLTIVGIFFVGVYVRSCRRRKTCTWWRGKDLTSSNTRENGVAASAAMNPSTDLLVTAQYAPVSEVAYQPPAALAAEERSKLMAENKDCGEESDRMLESDPRIVLRPQSHVEENV